MYEPVADPGEGPRGGLGPRSPPPPLLFLDQTEKSFWETVPSPPPLPSPLSPYLKVWIRHCEHSYGIKG